MSKQKSINLTFGGNRSLPGPSVLSVGTPGRNSETSSLNQLHVFNRKVALVKRHGVTGRTFICRVLFLPHNPSDAQGSFSKFMKEPNYDPHLGPLVRRGEITISQHDRFKGQLQLFGQEAPIRMD